MSHRPGRSWRPLQDTADEAQALYNYILDTNLSQSYNSWRRDVDFYAEGELLWLEVDTLIREQSAGKHSLDDFARLFYGINDGSVDPVTYTFDDVVAKLNQVQAYDWATFLRQRLQSTDEAAPLGGLARAGWRLGYSEEPGEFFKSQEKLWKSVDLTFRLSEIFAPR
jgi:predicted metalloprotease with PDZ domain